MVCESSRFHQHRVWMDVWSIDVNTVLVFMITLLVGCTDSTPDDVMMSSCIDDTYSVDGSEPVPLTLGQHTELVACANVPDRFIIRADVGDSIRIEIRSSSPISAILDGKASTGSRIGFDFIATEMPSELIIEGTGSTYSISVSERDNMGCGATVIEAFEVTDGQQSLVLCPGGISWFLLRGMAGQVVRYRFKSENGTELDGRVYERRDERYIVVGRLQSDSGGALSGGRIYPSEAEIYVRLNGVGSEGIIADVERDIGEANVRRVTGRLYRWTVPITEEGEGPPQRVPFAFGRLDLIDAETDMVIAAGFTDEKGDYDLPYAVEQSKTVHLLARAEAWSMHAPIRVGPLAEDEMSWSTIVAEFEVDTQLSDQLEIDESDPILGAFNIASIAAQGLRRLEGLLPKANLIERPLFYRWTPKAISGCGTCFIPGEEPLIELSGSDSDPDHWDDAVIFHELCHYVLARFSQDESPGMRHDGSMIQPTIAWSEGFATFCTSVLMDDSVQFDYRITGVRVLDIETIGDAMSFGTSTGEEDGELSEYLVAGLLWDLYDGGNEDDDGIQIALVDLLKPILGRLRTLMEDLGAQGPDLVDYLLGLACDGFSDEVVEAAASRRFPIRSISCPPGP